MVFEIGRDAARKSLLLELNAVIAVHRRADARRTASTACVEQAAVGWSVLGVAPPRSLSRPQQAGSSHVCCSGVDRRTQKLDSGVRSSAKALAISHWPFRSAPRAAARVVASSKRSVSTVPRALAWWLDHALRR